MENQCVGCGCTDSRACVGKNKPCHWLIVDAEMGIGVCSNCESHIALFKDRQESLQSFASES